MKIILPPSCIEKSIFSSFTKIVAKSVWMGVILKNFRTKNELSFQKKNVSFVDLRAGISIITFFSRENAKIVTFSDYIGKFQANNDFSDQEMK